jgi:hypothetical protein
MIQTLISQETFACLGSKFTFLSNDQTSSQIYLMVQRDYDLGSLLN